MTEPKTADYVPVRFLQSMTCPNCSEPFDVVVTANMRGDGWIADLAAQRTTGGAVQVAEIEAQQRAALLAKRLHALALVFDVGGDHILYYNVNAGWLRLPSMGDEVNDALRTALGEKKP